MIYYVYGEESLVHKKILEIISLNNILKEDISSYDLDEVSIKECLMSVNTYSLFSNIKAVIVYNFLSLDNEDEILRYIDNPSSNILILTDDVTDERRKVIKELKKKCNYIKVSDEDLVKFIKDELNTSLDVASLLKEYCNNNYFRVKNEVEKLKNLEVKIDKNVILENVKRSLESNVFALTNAIKNKNKEEIFRVYDDLVNSNVLDLQILGLLANHLRLLYKVKLLVLGGYKEDYIKDKLKIHPYRAKLFKEESYSYDIEEIALLIKSLAKLDIDIKSGKVSSNLGMKIFLSKF